MVLTFVLSSVNNYYMNKAYDAGIRFWNSKCVKITFIFFWVLITIYVQIIQISEQYWIIFNTTRICIIALSCNNHYIILHNI
jgi:hypothetical protein